MAEELAAFLDTPSGRVLVLRLAAQKPLYSTMQDANRRLVESGKAEGYEDALFKLIQHREFRAVAQSSSDDLNP